jgi:glucuronosyltransferase
MKFFHFLIFLIFISSINCAKILGVFPYPSRSHSILGQALFVELANRGHDVTYLSPYPFKFTPAKNYRDIAIESEDLFHAFDEEIDGSFDFTDANPVIMIKYWIENIARMQEFFLEDKNVQNFLKSGEKFDLCIIEFLMNESSLGFAAQFGCKVIGMSTLGQVKYVNDMMHAPMPLSTVG